MEKYIFEITDMADGSAYRLRRVPNGWEEYGVSFGRETDISNVVKSYSGSWEFYKEDGDYIWTKFATYGPNRRLKMTILALDDAMSGRYRKEYVGYIDLTQIQRSGGVVSVPIVEGGFFKALENKWSEDFSIPYDSFLNVTGNVFSETAHFTSPDSVDVSIMRDSTSSYYILGGELENRDDLSDTFFKTTNLQWIDIKDTPSSRNYSMISGNNAFLTARDIRHINRLSLDCSFGFHANIRGFGGSGIGIGETMSTIPVKLWLVSIPYELLENGTYIDIFGGAHNGVVFNYVGEVGGTFKFSHYLIDDPDFGTIDCNMEFSRVFDNIDCGSDKGCGYVFVLETRYSVGNNEIIAEDGAQINARFNYFSLDVGFEMPINVKKLVSCIPSERVFRRLIGKINDSRYNVTVSTSDFLSVADGDVLTSAPGMRYRLEANGKDRRQVIGGSITTNLGEFLKYCYAVYGFRLGVDYDMETDRYTVYLAHGDSMYSNSEICRLERVSNATFSVWRDALYSSITLGYDKDENAINTGRDFNCLYTLSTPNTEIEQNILEIVSPYSASTRSFETELYKDFFGDRMVEDGQIYLIGAIAKESASRTAYAAYEILRDIPITSGALFPNDEFNVKFSPKRMLMRHASEINGYMAFEQGKTIDVLTCDGNSDIVADGVSESQPMPIGPHRKFKPIVITLDSIGDSSIISKVAANRLGCFSFDFCGRKVKGYIAHTSEALSIHPMKEDASQFALLMADDSEGLA